MYIGYAIAFWMGPDIGYRVIAKPITGHDVQIDDIDIIIIIKIMN